MRSSIDVLDSYASAFRHLINAKVWSGRESIRELLRLNCDRDWNFLCTAMDVVGDASGAIRNFLQFGLDGPTRYQDVGEQYLRLYGLLSAVYIQQQSVIKLFELMNVPNPKNVRAQFDNLQIRDLRHKLASHSTDYANRSTQNIETYVPIQIGVRGFICTFTNNEQTTHNAVDLEKAIEEHCRLSISVLDLIYGKAAKTLYKGQDNKLAESMERLEDLRTEKEGGLVLRVQGGPKLVIHTVGDRNLSARSSRTRRKRRAG